MVINKYGHVGIGTVSTDTTNNTLNLVKKIDKNFTIIGESGIKSMDDIKKYNQLEIYNFLIGETLLKAQNKEKKIKELLGND